MSNVSETRPVKSPSSEAVRRLSIAASALTAAAIGMQALVKIVQQTGKPKEAKAGLEGAMRLTIAATLARAVPSILSEVRTISRELRR